MPPARKECSQTNSQLEAGETCFCSSAHTMGIGTGSAYCGSIGVECANTQNFNDNMVVEPNGGGGGGVQLDVSAFWDSTSRNGLRKEIGWECLEAMIALEHKGLATLRSTYFFDGACARGSCVHTISRPSSHPSLIISPSACGALSQTQRQTPLCASKCSPASCWSRRAWRGRSTSTSAASRAGAFSPPPR